MYSLDVIVPFFNEEDFVEESVSNLIKANVHDHIYLVNNNNIKMKVHSEKDIENRKVSVVN